MDQQVIALFERLTTTYFRSTHFAKRSTEDKIIECVQEFKMTLSTNHQNKFIAWAFLPSGEVGYAADENVKVAMVRSIIKLLETLKPEIAVSAISPHRR